MAIPGSDSNDIRHTGGHLGLPASVIPPGNKLPRFRKREAEKVTRFDVYDGREVIGNVHLPVPIPPRADDGPICAKKKVVLNPSDRLDKAAHISFRERRIEG